MDTINLKKNIKSNKGFTLVECIVAFALFAILAAVLFGIIGVSAEDQRRNNALNNNLKEQQEAIAKAQYYEDATSQSVSIPFSNGESLSINNASVNSATINSDGSKMDNGLNLNVIKAPYSAPSSTIDPNDPSYILATAVVYGSSGLTQLHIEEKENTTATLSDGTEYHHIKLYLKITDNNYVLTKKQISSKNRNFLKLRLPSNAYNLKISNNVYLTYSTMDSNEYDIDGIATEKATCIRFIRSDNSNVVNTDAFIEFDIKSSDYANFYINFNTYFNISDPACNFKEYNGLGIYRNDVT